jgi:hypothetical protein
MKCQSNFFQNKWNILHLNNEIARLMACIHKALFVGCQWKKKKTINGKLKNLLRGFFFGFQFCDVAEMSNIHVRFRQIWQHAEYDFIFLKLLSFGLHIWTMYQNLEFFLKGQIMAMKIFFKHLILTFLFLI